MRDIGRLIVEIGAKNGIRIEPDDPAIAFVILNELMLEDIAKRVEAHIEATLGSFESVMDNLEKRAGASFANALKATAKQVRTEIQKDIDAAGIKAAHLVYLVDQAHKRPARLRTFAFAFLLAVILAGASFYVGLCLRHARRDPKNISRSLSERPSAIPYRLNGLFTK